jgi:hypothetical protein
VLVDALEVADGPEVFPGYALWALFLLLPCYGYQDFSHSCFLPRSERLSFETHIFVSILLLLLPHCLAFTSGHCLSVMLHAVRTMTVQKQE